MRTYRQRLEQEMNQIMDMLEVMPESDFGVTSMRERLKDIGEILDELDKGTHFSQAVGETQPRIVVADLQAALQKKVSNL